MPAALKWSLIILSALSTMVLVFALYSNLVANPRVASEITSNPDGERAGIVMLLTLPDGKQIPVNYLREGNLVFAGADGPWWRAFRGDGARVSLMIRGETHVGHGTVVLDNPDYVEDVFSRLRPSAPDWLPDWLNGKLVVIALTPTTAAP